MTRLFFTFTCLACMAWLAAGILAGTAQAQLGGDGGGFRGGYCGTARFGGWQAERPFTPDANLLAQGPGQLVIRDPRDGAWQRLPIARYHVNVILHAPVALVQIDQTFYNPYFTQQEGVFLFNLPPGASVSRFAMYATRTELIEGQLVDRGRVPDVCDSVVRGERDPVAAESVGANVFRIRVFPVPGRDVKRILIDYTVPLEPGADGPCRFSLPLLNDLEPISDLRIGGRVFGPTPRESIASPSHGDLKLGDLIPASQAAEDAGEAREPFGGASIPFEVARRDCQSREPFSLEFRHAPEGPVAVQCYRAKGLVEDWRRNLRPTDPDSRGPLTYFRLEVRDGPPGFPSREPLDLLILADTSAYARGRPEVAQAVQRLVGHVRPEDRVRLVCVDAAARPMHDGWAAAGSDELKRAVERMENEFCLGGVDLVRSVGEAIESAGTAEAGRRRLAVYVGTGEYRWGSGPEAEVVEPLVQLLGDAGVVFMSFYVPASRPNLPPGLPADAEVAALPRGRNLLEALSLAVGGLLWDAREPALMRAHQAWLERDMPIPIRITDVRVSQAEPNDLIFPPAWTPGEPFVILGRVPTELVGDGLDLRLAAVFDGKAVQWRHHLTIDAEPDNLLVGRLWAQHKLSELALLLPEKVPPNSEAYHRLIALSREWNVLTPLTAFLLPGAPLNDSRYGIDASPRRYWDPLDRAQGDPLSPEWLAQASAARRMQRSGEHSQEADARLLSNLTGDLRHRDVLAALAWQRSLFAPLAETPLRERLSLEALFVAPAQPGDDYERLFPHYPRFLKPVNLETPIFSVEDLANRLHQWTGVRVEIDRQASGDQDKDVVAAFDAAGLTPGRGTVSVWSYAKHVPALLGLTLLPEPNRLLLTTNERAAEIMQVGVYPVADLYLPDRKLPLELLADPFYDHRLISEQRIQQRLQRPISVSASRVPLRDAVYELADRLDVALVIDDEAARLLQKKTPPHISFEFNDVPGAEALATILSHQELSYIVRDEAVVVTTPDTAEDTRFVRLHSVRGVLYESPAPLDNEEWGEDGDAFEDFSGRRRGGIGTWPPRSAEGSLSFGGEESNAATAAHGAATGASGRASRAEREASHAKGRRSPVDAGAIGRIPGEAPVLRADYDSIIETIISTIAPESWDEVGGPGSVVPMDSTLDLVVSQTAAVHARIEALLARLRSMPPVIDDHSILRPATLPQTVRLPRHQLDSAVDLESLISVITRVECPGDWDEVGGPGSITADAHRGALVVWQTQEVHGELLHLLTQLRRSRYEQLWADRPWLAEVGPHRPMIDPWGLGAMAEETRADKLPRPRPGERAALAWRRMPAKGQWVWRRVTPGGETVETITLVQDGPRLEVVLPECSIRIEGDMAAVAWPEFRLVEIGPWAEAVRHALDARLPWLPHRSNANLARWYDVLPASGEDVPADEERPAADEKAPAADEKAPAADEEGSAADEEGPAADEERPVANEEGKTIDEKAKLSAVRLVPPGFGPNGGTWLLVEPSDVEHLPGRISSFVGGKRTGRVRWAGETFEGSAILWENAAGEPLARWELVDYAVESAPVPPLAEPREGFIPLDRRGESAEDTVLAEALAALGQRDWVEAESQLAKAAQRHPGHPLVAMLRAWCHGQACDVGRHDPPDEQLPDERLAELRAAVAAGHGFVFQWIAEGEPAWLSADTRYELLRGYPEKPRDLSDVLALARLAMQTRRYDEGLELLDRAMEADLTAGDRGAAFQHRRLSVELLLKRDRIPEAEAAAEQWSQRADAAPGEIAALAECLLAANRREVATRLLTQAATADGPAADRARLLRRLADLHEGVARWELLVEAADLLPEDSPVFQQWVAKLFDELAAPLHAEIPAQLAQKASSKGLRARLRIRHADLLADASAAGDIFWELAEEVQLPPERLYQTMALWNRAKQPERTITVCERELRRGRPLGDHLPAVLHDAYQAVNRPIDAHRAATEP